MSHPGWGTIEFTEGWGDHEFAVCIDPAGPWRPWPGRMSRWWWEIMAREVGGEWFLLGYEPGGSGGGFTLRSAIVRGSEAVWNLFERRTEWEDKA